MTDDPTPARRRPAHWPSALAYVLAVLLVGALGGVVWRTTTPLPGYTVGSDGKAVISELALTQLFTADARYAVIGIVGGLVLGGLAVLLLRNRGWRVVVWSTVGPVLAGLAAWGAGIVGAVPLKDRLASATVGRTEPVDLALNAPVAVLLWPFAAVLVVLVWSAFAPDPPGSRSVEGPDRGDGGPEQPHQVAGGDLELE